MILEYRKKVTTMQTAMRLGAGCIALSALLPMLFRPAGDFTSGVVDGVRLGLLGLSLFWYSHGLRLKREKRRIK